MQPLRPVLFLMVRRNKTLHIFFFIPKTSARPFIFLCASSVTMLIREMAMITQGKTTARPLSVFLFPSQCVSWTCSQMEPLWQTPTLTSRPAVSFLNWSSGRGSNVGIPIICASPEKEKTDCTFVYLASPAKYFDTSVYASDGCNFWQKYIWV